MNLTFLSLGKGTPRALNPCQTKQLEKAREGRTNPTFQEGRNKHNPGITLSFVCIAESLDLQLENVEATAGREISSIR